MSSIRGGRTSFIANSDIPTGSRVKYVGANKVDLAGSGDREIGVAGEQKTLFRSGSDVEVLLNTEPGSRFLKCSGATADGDLVRRDAGGAIQTNALGDVFGLALEAGTAGDLIEVLPLRSEQQRGLTFLGHNGAGACVCAGLTVGDKVISLQGITTPGDASASFEAVVSVAGQIQQTSAADLHASAFLVSVLHTS